MSVVSHGRSANPGDPADRCNIMPTRGVTIPAAAVKQTRRHGNNSEYAIGSGNIEKPRIAKTNSSNKTCVNDESTSFLHVAPNSVGLGADEGRQMNRASTVVETVSTNILHLAQANVERSVVKSNKSDSIARDDAIVGNQSTDFIQLLQLYRYPVVQNHS